jgi:hypothetical protein
MDVGCAICDAPIKFRNLGIEEFRDFSKPDSIPQYLNSQFLNAWIPHLRSDISHPVFHLLRICLQALCPMLFAPCASEQCKGESYDY